MSFVRKCMHARPHSLSAAGGIFFCTILPALLAALVSVSCMQPGISASCGLSGKVLDKNGAPIAGVTIRLGDSPDADGPSATSSADGSFALSGLASGNFRLNALKQGKVFILKKINGAAADSLVPVNAGSTSIEVLGLDADAVRIPDIQGPGARSPLEGQRVQNVIGVITKITKRTVSPLYDTTLTDGSTTPQWVSDDGFYMEAYGSCKDGDPATSDGIFVYTHDPAYVESKWLQGIPLGLAEGDVVAVSGLVAESCPTDRFGSNDGLLTMTRIENPAVIHVTDTSGSSVTHSYPAGVLLTYADSPSLPSGVTEYRTLPWEDSGQNALKREIDILESVESMVVRVDNPLVTSSTYYNVTGILADSGRKNGSANKNLNTTVNSIVLQDPSIAGMDFNTELLFCDYQKPDWKTFNPLPQVGDLIKDSTGASVLRGVMEYTSDGIYMIRPLQHAASLTDALGNTIPPQGWDFDVSALNASQATNFKALNSSMTRSGGAVYDWRIGSACDSRFQAPWAQVANGGTDSHLTVASYNIENYENQGKPYSKDLSVAQIIVNNLHCPDVVILVEMGDDYSSTTLYANQDNSYSIPDGIVTSVKNLKGIAGQLAGLSGLTYGWRCIDPEELKDGGQPGTNIRVCFMFRKDRVAFVDRGLVTNTDENCSSSDESRWPVQFPSQYALTLARTSTGVARDSAGQVALTQSPGRICGSQFDYSRKPLAGEFVFKPTGEKFFVVAAHLGSKTGDTPLYGSQQPPVFGSDAHRTEQGKAVYRLLRSILNVDPNARIVVGGDMNDFPWSDAIKAMTGESTGARTLYSVTKQYMPDNEQYSYAFKGNLQQIDHIFISPRLKNAADADGYSTSNYGNLVFIPHIDSLFSKNNHIQTSDHDPVVVRLGGF